MADLSLTLSVARIAASHGSIWPGIGCASIA
jgi:hypothetical protein